MRATSVASVAGAVLLLAGCGAATEEPPTRLRLRVVVARTGTISERLELPARLLPPADLDSTLAPRVAGRLRSVPVELGQEVEAGALLAEVDAGSLEQALRSTEAEVARARMEEGFRQQAAALTASLFERGIVSAEERNADQAAAAAATASLVEAEARRQQARLALDWTLLRAPFAGVVAELFRHQGDSVDGSPATPVMRLASRARTEAVALATAADLNRIPPEAAAEVRLEGGAPAPAHVTRVSAAVSPTSGLGEVRAALDAPPPAPLFADVRLTLVLATHAGAVLLPTTALRRTEEGSYEVVLVVEGAARVQPVEAGLSTAGEVEILAGVDPGGVVVEEPLGIASGTPVEPLGP